MSLRRVATVQSTTPKGLRWTQEKAANAANEGFFIHVGGNQLGRRKISTAEKYWKGGRKRLPENDIFVQEYYITGPRDAVIYALRNGGIPENRINAAVNAAITRDNYMTLMNADYNRLLDIEKRLAKPRTAISRVRKEPRRSLREYAELAALAKDPKNLSQVAAPRVARTGRTRTGAVVRPKKSLIEKVNERGVDLIDVSKMTVDGSGVRKMKVPVEGSRTLKFHVPGLPFISDKIDTFKEAVLMVYGQAELDRWTPAIDEAYMRKIIEDRNREISTRASTRARRTSTRRSTRKSSTKARKPRASAKSTRSRTTTRSKSPTRLPSPKSTSTVRSPLRTIVPSPRRASPLRTLPTTNFGTTTFGGFTQPATRLGVISSPSFR